MEHETKKQKIIISAVHQSLRTDLDNFEALQSHSQKPIGRNLDEISEKPDSSIFGKIQNVSKSFAEEDTLDNCRLRHGLKANCHLEIFKYLAIEDLFHLSEMDIYYKNLIENWVICKKLIHFKRMKPQNVHSIFQMFGKKVRMIRFERISTLRSFDELLHFIIQYCSVGTLTEISLDFMWLTASVNILEKAMPFFSNLRKLVLSRTCHGIAFIRGILPIATNLAHLTLYNVDNDLECLLVGGMENLRELRIRSNVHPSYFIFPQHQLPEFLRTKSQLEVFDFVGFNDIQNVINELTKNCPKLREFTYFQRTSFRNSDEVRNISAEMKEKYNFLRKFRHLKQVGLTFYAKCGSDLYYPLQMLAVQNQIEELRIFTDRATAIELLPEDSCRCLAKHLPHFTSLKSVEFVIQGGQVSGDFDFYAEFMYKVISKLSNVEQFRVKSEWPVLGINKVIDMAPNLKSLNVSEAFMLQSSALKGVMGETGVEIQQIYNSIEKRHSRQILNGEQNPRPIHLVVNRHQWQKLQEISAYNKDIHQMLTTSIYDGEYAL